MSHDIKSYRSVLVLWVIGMGGIGANAWAEQSGCLLDRLSPDSATTVTEEFARTLDLTDPLISTEPGSGGTSVYLKIKNAADLWGALLPPNSATQIEGEVFSYQLARFFGVNDWVGPGSFFELRDKNLEAFALKIKAVPVQGGSARARNKKHLVALLNQHPASLQVALKKWGLPPKSCDFILEGGRLKPSHRIAQALLATSPPPNDEEIPLGKLGAASEWSLARQLSSIFVIDILAGQGDRFSGGNLQAVIKDGRPQFVAYDNGGTFGRSDEYFERYQRMLSRFDRRLADSLLALDNALQSKSFPLRIHSGSSCMEFSSESALRSALGLADVKWNSYWKMFLRRVRLLATHIRQTSGDKFFKSADHE